ncbi:alpha/beta fold hydrolase [Nocardioides humi]|uniref:alpha/beta fold hydrolase n=1 Tax=Nocardioides humi TaxID=449461 RepID=UPI001C6446B8|nr:alpha/beta fold hydrolase [Nocardioides humi]
MTTVRTSDGVRLHHTDTGPGTTGTTVVLVAGFMASAFTWQLQVDALAAAGHRVVCLDRRNHGLSDFPAYGQRMGRHGQDLHEALTQLAIDDAVVVGGSQGASTVWACLDLHGTDRIRAVVSVDQTPRMLNGTAGSTASTATTARTPAPTSRRRYRRPAAAPGPSGRSRPSPCWPGAWAATRRRPWPR